MDSRRNEVLVVAALFFVLTWITVGLRCYVRAVMTKTFGMDDYYILAALGVFTVYLAFQITAALHGTGRHRSDLTDHDARTALKFWYLCELIYVLANCLLKFAIGHFYLRVAAQQWHIWTIRLLMMGTVLFSVIYFFLVMLQCLPINVFWNLHPASEQCLPKGPTLGITYALAAVNAAADWVFGTLPLLIVWDLKMKFKTKLLVGGILAFAAVGSTGTVVRMFYIDTLMDGPDFLWATTDIAIWSTVEPGIGITAGSIACLRPLIRVLLWRLGLAKPPRHQRIRTYYPWISGQKLKYIPEDRLVLTGRDCNAFIPMIEISAPRKSRETSVKIPPAIVETEPEHELVSNEIRQTITVVQVLELPPRLELRHSLRQSFTRGSILSLGRLRVPKNET